MVGEAEHQHCKVCGRVTAPGDETCSKKCATERQQRIRSRRNLQYMLYASIALVVVFLVSAFVH